MKIYKGGWKLLINVPYDYKIKILNNTEYGGGACKFQMMRRQRQPEYVWVEDVKALKMLF